MLDEESPRERELMRKALEHMVFDQAMKMLPAGPTGDKTSDKIAHWLKTLYRENRRLTDTVIHLHTLLAAVMNSLKDPTFSITSATPLEVLLKKLKLPKPALALGISLWYGMKGQNLTNDELAKMVGVTRRQIARYRLNQWKPRRQPAEPWDDKPLPLGQKRRKNNRGRMAPTARRD